MMTIDQALSYLDSQAREAKRIAKEARKKDQKFAARAVAIALEETAEVIRGDGKEEGKRNG